MSIDGKVATRKRAENWCPKNAKPKSELATTMWRPCLRCKQRFPSEGVHNRLCGPCRRNTDLGTFEGPYRLSS